MSAAVRLSHTSALILQSIGTAHHYGFDVMEVTGLPSGTVYPALRRLERDRLIVSRWEELAASRQRPLRRYYKLTPEGTTALHVVQQRYPLLRHLAGQHRPVRRKGAAA
ncbi:MAG TPA: PadR family transcriptional regulator [Terriglobales bacterium]|jgi:DNA-binding PadR family transcriptional regulator|nr:PadR family transcriptional regulator [Terriglobales bacterium]